MKIFTRSLFLLLILLVNALVPSQTFAQCPGGNNNGTIAFGCNSELTLSPQNTGDYRFFTVISGISYNFNSNGSPFNSYLYAREDGTGPLLINQDVNNIGGDDETVNWTATFTGSLGVAIHQSGCTWPPGVGNSNSAVLRYKQNTTINNNTTTVAVCMGSTKTLAYTLVGTHNNPAVSWSITGGTGSGTISNNIFTPTAAGTVTVAATVGVCTSTGVTFTVNSNSVAPTSIGTSFNPICPNGPNNSSTTLSVSGGSLGTGAAWQWHTGSCSGPSAGTGSTLLVEPDVTTTYYVNAVGTCNTTTCAEFTVSVNSESSVSSAAATPTTICIGQSSTLSVTGSPGTGATWNWYTGSCGGTWLGQGASISVSPTSPTTYYVRAEGTCNTTTCASVSVNVNPQPSITLGTINAVCAGANSFLIPYSSPVNSPDQYSISSVSPNIMSGFTAVTNQSLGNSPITVNIPTTAAAGTYNFNLTVRNSSTGCVSAVYPFTVTINPLPTITLGTISSICFGAASFSIPYTATLNMPDQYSVTTTGPNAMPNFNAVTNNGLVGSPRIVNIPANTPTGTYNFNLTVRNSSTGCVSQVYPFTVTINPLPNDLSFSAQTSPICYNTATTILVANSQSGVNYQLRNNSNNTPVGIAVAGTGGQISLPTGNLTNQTTFNILATNASTGCNRQLSGTVTVAVNPLPTNINPTPQTQSVCIGSSANIQINPSQSGVSYQLRNNTDNSTVGSPVTGNGNAIQLNTGTLTTATTYNVLATVSNTGCSSQMTQTVTVNINPLPNGNLSGSTTICNGQQASLTFTATVGTGPYTVSYTDGTTTFGPYTVSSGGALPAISPASTATYTLTSIQDANGCIRTLNFGTAATVTVNPLPTITLGTINGVCYGSGSFSLPYTATTNGADQYSISSAMPGFIPVSNATLFSSPLSVDIPLTTLPGNYIFNLSVRNSTTGCTSSAATQFFLTVFPLPDVVTFSADTTICWNGQATLTVVFSGNTPTPFSFTYEDNHGNVPVTVSNINSHTYTFNVQDSAIYTITSVTDGNLCQKTISKSVQVQKHPQPDVPVLNLSTAEFCQGNSVVLNVTNYDVQSSYSWSTGAVGQFAVINTAGNVTVTATDVNGCNRTSDPTNVIVHPTPAPVITPTGSLGFVRICDGDSVLLSVTQTYEDYLWSPGGATTQSIMVNTSDTFTVAVMDIYGCEGSASKTVIINSLPQPTITPFGGNGNNGSTTFCAGNSVNLQSSSANIVSYLWSPGGETSQTINVDSSGSYSVAVMDINGCEGESAPTVVTVNEPPVAAITPSGPVTFCQGSSVVLTASAGSSYLWSNGATTSSITINQVNQSGSYTVRVTGANGCSALSSTVTVTVNPVPFALITPSPTASICNGGSVTLSAIPNNEVSYSWNTSPVQTTSSITVSPVVATPYAVTITNSFGCSTTSSATTVNVNTPPTITINSSSPNDSVCAGNSITLTANPAGLSSYQWSNGLVSQSITVSTTDTFTVTVTDANGCTAQASRFVTINPLPTVSFSGLNSNYCVNNSTGETLTGSPSGGTFTISGGVGLSGSTFTPSVAGLGTFTITYTYNDGNCTNSTSQTVTVHALPTPTITAQSATTFCFGGSVVLTTEASTSYQWSPGGATTQIITVSQVGSNNYTVTSTNAFGCSATSDPVLITVYASPTPVITSTNNDPLTFCEGGSVTLETIDPYASYSWLPGLQTSDSIVATTSGNYRVSVTNGNGCSGTSDITTVTVNPNPVPTISGSLTFCDGQNTTLTASPAASYLWSPGNETTPSISVNTIGTYSVQVWDVNNCTGTASVNVTETANPVITVFGSATLCQGDSVILFSSSSINNQWSTGETTQSITVSAPDTIILEVGFGSCQGSDTVIITVNPLPSVNFTGLDAAYCSDAGVVTLTGDPVGGTFSGPGISGNTFNPAAAGNGTHNITYNYSDVNGCSNSTTKPVTVNNLPNVTFSGLASQYCANTPSVILYGSPAGGIFTANPSGIIIGDTLYPSFGAGTYTITYTYSDGSGCESSSSQTVTVHAAPVVSFIGLDPDYCEDEPAVNLTGSPVGGSFSGNGIIGNQFFPYIPGAGTHTVTYTLSNSFGCSSSSSQQVTVHAIPTVSFSGFNVPHAYCVDASSVTLTGSPVGGTFSGTGITDSSFNPATAGVGTHVITYTYSDGFGCENTTTQSVTVNPLPTVTATALGSTTICSGDVVTMYSSSGTGNVWSPNGETTQFVFVTATANYSVTVTDANGCDATSDTINVIVNSLPAPEITGGPTEFCAGGNVTLSTTTLYPQYLWSNGATSSSITVDQSDDYSVTVTDANGCSNTSAPETVIVNPLPNAQITPSGTVGICSGSSLTITASGGVTYLWSPIPATTDSVIVTSAGTYSATVTDDNGCVSVTPSTTVFINNNPIPTITAFGSTTFCQGGSVTLISSANANYLWSNGETNQIISATTSGNYSVTVTDGNGCIGTSSPDVVVTVNPLPVVNYSGLAAQYCVDANPVLLTVSPSGGFFTGPVTGNTFNPALAGVGSHVITYQFTNGNGCSNSYSQTVVVHPLPTPSFTGLGAEYCVDAASVTLTGSPVGGTFSGPGISGLQFNPATAGAGTHTITYTYTDGNGCTNSTTQSVTVHPLPVVSFTGLDTEYCIDEPTATLVPSPAGGTFSGTGISGNTFSPATAGAGTYTITYTYTDANTCTNSTSQTVTVHPLPVVTFTALAAQYCITETSVSLSGSPSGGTFTGTGVTGNTFNPSVAGVGSHLLTYTYTDANGCTSFATRTAVVVPLPVVSFSGLDAAYCVDGGADALTGSPAGGTFSGIGISGNNFVPSTAGVGTHTIIYTYTDAFGCTNSTSQSTTVNPLPVISFSGLGQDYCINETPATLVGSPNTGTFSGPGISGNIFSPATAGAGVHTVTFTYTDINGCIGVLTQSVTVYSLPVVIITPITDDFCVTETSVTLSATPAGGTFSGSGVSGNMFNPSVAGVGTHTITYFYTDANGCTNSTTTTISVVALPTVSFSGLSTQYCVDAAAVTLTGSPSGGTFSGNGVTGNTFNPATAGVGSSTVTYSYSDGNGCTNSTSQNTVVTPLPIVSISGLALEYCVDAAAVSLTGNPAGGAFSGAGMIGGIFTPADAGVGAHTISYSYTDGNGCDATATASVTVNDLPSVNIDNTTLQYCESETTVALTATPSGGTFSGNGVSGSNFNPSLAGTGTHTITYEYTDGNGCVNSTSIDFEVVPLPAVSFSGLAVQYCEDGNVVTLTGNPAGGVFSGDGVTGDTFDPGAALVGPVDVTYTYTDGNGCTNSETQTTNVYSLPIVQFTGLFTEYCVDADAVELTPLPAGGAFIGPGMNGNTFTPASAGIGTHTITYAFQNQVGCIGTVEQTVEIHGLPVVSFTGLASIYCLEADSVPLTGTPVGGYFSGPALNDSVFYPFYAGQGQHTITYTYYDDNGCTSSQSQTLNVYQLSQPEVTTNGPVDFCEGDDVTLTAQPPFMSYLWSNGATTQSITVDTESEAYVTIQDVNGCRSTSDTIDITVYPLPVVDLGDDVSLCPGTTLTLDAGAGFVEYVWVPGGSTGQTLTIVASNSTAGDYRASVTDANGCFNYDEMTLAVFTPQVPVVTANGSPSICDGQTVVLNAGAGFQDYLWSNTINTQLNSITQSGSYSVTTTDQNGCMATSTPFNVTVIPLPVVTVFANGPTEICEGNTVILVMPSGYVNYVWNNGGTTSSIVVDEAGDYFGSATNSAGCSNITSTITVTVYAQPQPIITPQGPVTVCFGESIVLDAGDLGYEEYNWFRNLNPLNIHSQFAPVGQSGNYTVEVIDTNGCGAGVNSPPVSVTVLPELIPLISISADQDTLYSTTAQTYQWNYNGVPVNGANLQWFVPQASGNYSVTVTDNNDCEGTSAIIEFSYSGIGMDENAFSYINLFPNPGKGRFTVVAEFNVVTNANIVVTDMLGHSVMPAINVKGVSSMKQDISVEDFANGVYFVSIITDNGQKVIRYIKE